MSRYGGGSAGGGGGNDYHRDRRERSPPRFPDRRPSYNEPPRAPRGRELRDAPPLSRPFRDARDFAPRDADPPRPRRNSRDGPLSAGPTYSESASSFRGGFGRGRGRGDPEFRVGRGGRRFDDRDVYPRDRSPPPPPLSRWSRDDRSPPRRDDRRFDRREDGRWNDGYSDRESDRWRDQSQASADGRPTDSQSASGNASANAGLVNPDRMALIDDKGSDLSLRRASTINVPPHSSRRDMPDVPPYLSGRADSAGSKYASRAPSSPTQPPPVPAFTLSFTPSAQPAAAVKTEARPDGPPSSTTEMTAQKSPVLPRAPKSALQSSSASSNDVPLSAPRAPKALEAEMAGNSSQRLHGVKSWDSLPNAPSAPQSRTASVTQPTSPVLQTSSRPMDLIPPTGPKATRTSSQTCHSPRPPFSEIDSTNNAANRSRTPPPDAPLGPRGHTYSRSPEMSFVNAPTGPKSDRAASINPRQADRTSTLARTSDKITAQGTTRAPPTAPRSQQQAWNLWRRGTAPGVIEKRDTIMDERRPEQRSSEQTQPATTTDTTRHREAPMTADTKPPASPAKGHSAQQSFFGQPAAAQYDELASDVADDSISSSDDDEIEVEDLALFEAKFKRRQRELEAKLIDLSAREYRGTTPLETIARLARVTMRDVERFKERDVEMDLDDAPPRHGVLAGSATQSSASEEAADLPTPKGEENAAVQIHTEEEADEDVRRIFRPVPEVITLPYMTRDTKHSIDFGLQSDAGETLEKSIEHEYEADFSKRENSASNLEQEFTARYQAWRELCEDLDYLREKQEEMERQMSLEPGPEPDAPPNAASTAVYEGRRLHKFASEYEMEQVIKQSEETARLEQEKADREAKRVQADMEKEAELPDQLTKSEYLAQAFVDDNRLRDSESLTVVFTYEPAPDNFTEEEQQIFVAAFKETPKKWTEIASLLPGREPKDCIRHYYTNKWDGRFRDNKHRRNKAGRRGRGGKTVRSRGSAMADLAGGDEMPVAVSDSGRPKRAAAPTTFAEKESEAKTLLSNQSPAKRSNVKQEGAADSEKPAKRRKGAGEKPGRKPKGTQPLAQIAAAPTMSPEGRSLQIVQSKESLDRSRALEDASLLTSFHAGRPALPVDQQSMFPADKFMSRTMEESDRMRVPLPASSTKPGPSSYWSVPEQGDFMKYIAYFGTDFAAIAAHMGTKTQTMIKNHYQRQIDGSHPGLEESALAANARRQRGENIGAPPTPTPITKRKYDSAATMSQRAIVPQGGDPMDIDEPRSTSRPALNKHGSPPQLSLRPQYPPTTVPTPQLSHAGPGLSAQDQPPGSLNAPSRSYQSSISGRPSMFSDNRSDSRSSVSGAPTFFPPASGASSQPLQSTSRSQDSHDPYIRGLLEEQQRAIRLQDQQYQEHDQGDPYYHRTALQQQPAHRSPSMSHAHAHQHERRSLGEYRANTPPASYHSARSTPGDASRKMSDRAQHLLDPIRFPPPNPQAIPSPPKRDGFRPMPATSTFNSAPAKPPTPASEAPKRMDLFSMLNTTEEPKQKRSSLDPVSSSAATQAGSPAQPNAHAASPYSSSSRARSDHYGQPPVNQYSASSSSRPPLSHLSGSARSPAPPTPLKQEALPSGMPPKQEWPARSSVHSMTNQPALPLERDVRPYYSHRSSVYQQEPVRANPSPPPVLHHSRAPSVADPAAHSRGYGSQPAAPPTSNIGVGSSIYSNPPAYSHAGSLPGSTAPSHHSHPAQASHNYAPLHHRGPSRDDPYAREQAMRESEREREEREREWRYQRDRDEAERQRMEAEQRRQEHDRHYSRASAPSLQPPSYSISYDASPSRMANVGMSLREQSARDAEIAMQQQAERMSSMYGREREQALPAQPGEDARRRHDDAYAAARRTPLGSGGYGAPPLPGPGRR